MDELSRSVDHARLHVRPTLTDERSRAIEIAIVTKMRRNARSRRIGALASAFLLLLGIAGAWRWQKLSTPEDDTRRLAAPVAASAPSASVDRVLRFADGSWVMALDESTVIETKDTKADSVVVVLTRGAAKFHVVHNPSRLFIVEAGDVTIEDLGTVFTAARVQEHVRVSVETGSVRGRWPGGEHDVLEGQSELLPTSGADAGVSEQHAPSVSAPRPSGAWRVLAQEGQFAEAYTSLVHDGPATVKDDVEDLLLAADVARLSHHPASAVPPLRKVLTHHRADERAALASFTLGRVLLDDLGRPREAAEAFSDAQRLAPDGALSEDALARQVEAFSRAGDALRARESAERYVRQYPHGTRTRSVQRNGGLVD